MDERIASLEDRINSIQVSLDVLPDVLSRCIQQQFEHNHQQQTLRPPLQPQNVNQTGVANHNTNHSQQPSAFQDGDFASLQFQATEGQQGWHQQSHNPGPATTAWPGGNQLYNQHVMTRPSVHPTSLKVTSPSPAAGLPYQQSAVPAMAPPPSYQVTIPPQQQQQQQPNATSPTGGVAHHTS